MANTRGIAWRALSCPVFRSCELTEIRREQSSRRLICACSQRPIYGPGATLTMRSPQRNSPGGTQVRHGSKPCPFGEEFFRNLWVRGIPAEFSAACLTVTSH
jgi:hypothetical protein